MGKLDYLAKLTLKKGPCKSPHFPSVSTYSTRTINIAQTWPAEKIRGAYQL